LEELKFPTSQLQKNPRDLIDFGRIWTTSGKIPDFGLFHQSALRAGAFFAKGRQQAGKTRKAEVFRFPGIFRCPFSILHWF
jgi:hypothetical protein